MEKIQQEYVNKYFRKFGDIFEGAKNNYLRMNGLKSCSNQTIVKVLAEHLGVSEIMIKKQIQKKVLASSDGKLSILSQDKIIKLNSCDFVVATLREVADLQFFAEACRTSTIVLQYIHKLEKRVKRAENKEIDISYMRGLVSKELLESLILFFQCKRTDEWYDSLSDIQILVDFTLTKSKLMKEGDEYGDNTIGNERR